MSQALQRLTDPGPYVLPSIGKAVKRATSKLALRPEDAPIPLELLNEILLVNVYWNFYSCFVIHALCSFSNAIFGASCNKLFMTMIDRKHCGFGVFCSNMALTFL